MKHIAITENHLYQKAYKGGKHIGTGTVVLYVLKDYRAGKIMLANPQKKYLNRLGLSVSKKIGGAVQRNRAKRVITAAFRECLPGIEPGYDFVIVARTRILEIKSTAAAQTMKKLLFAAGIYDYDKQNIDKAD